jgi:hypothetical protein
VIITSFSFSLPSDFLTVASTKDVDGNILAPIGFDQKVDRYSYKIIDGTIYSDAVNYTLYYRKMFSGLVTLDDALPLDSGFFELLKKYVVVYLLGGYNKSNSVSIDNINKELGSLLQGREFGHISWQLPFSL